MSKPHEVNVAETLRRTPTTQQGAGERRYLLVLEDGSSSLLHLPQRGTVVIGRGSDVGLRLQHASVSRRHARLVLDEDRVQILDLGSSNGTSVGGEPVVAPRALRTGDVILVGDVTLVYHGSGARAGEVPADADSPPGVTELDLDGRTILVADPAMARLFELIRRLARSDLPVLIHGETGAGKENAAFAVHHYSPRSGRPFLAVNCAAIHESLVESELFGHERGAFTGAVGAKAGLFESASGGTVFLDEVGELPAGVQAKLLRVLEERRITRVGDVREREVDLRVVAATNRDLEREVAEGRFRQDLFFRLSAATVILPPLRERPREIPVLARMFLLRAGARVGRTVQRLSPATMQVLLQYAWPGNVRELRNLMDYVAAAVVEDVIEPGHLPDRVRGRAQPSAPLAAVEPAGAGAEAGPEGRLDGRPDGRPEAPGATTPKFRAIAEELRDLERTRMVQALEVSGGVRKRAAELLDMPLRTFVMKLKQYGIR